MKEKNKIITELFDWAKMIVIGLAVGFLASRVLVTSAQVPTGSMENTVMTGSRLIKLFRTAGRSFCLCSEK